ncbi:hypothetical protein [Anabaena sp. UHCC 0451]|uniref:hypothetical protein n=1 Tax=Anabaena sp. UHCC 0451 TaxID=2055235 RepID=UPI003A4C6175
MLAQFQSLYPNSSIISELVQIFQGKYIVRVSLQIEGVTRATGMAGADTVEVAEDQARNRALMVLGITNTTNETVAFSAKPIDPVPVNSTIKTTYVLNESVPDAGSPASNTYSSPVVTQNSNTNLKKDTYNQPLNQIDQTFSGTTTREEQFDTSAPNLEIVSSPESEPQPLPEITASNVTPFTPRSYSPPEDVGLRSGMGKRKNKSEPVNLSDVIAQTDVQIERLGWTKEQGREHLKTTYGKLGRSLLSEEELLDFLNFLKSQPDPIAGF